MGKGGTRRLDFYRHLIGHVGSSASAPPPPPASPRIAPMARRRAIWVVVGVANHKPNPELLTWGGDHLGNTTFDNRLSSP